MNKIIESGECGLDGDDAFSFCSAMNVDFSITFLLDLIRFRSRAFSRV